MLGAAAFSALLAPDLSCICLEGVVPNSVEADRFSVVFRHIVAAIVCSVTLRCLAAWEDLWVDETRDGRIGHVAHSQRRACMRRLFIGLRELLRAVGATSATSVMGRTSREFLLAAFQSVEST